MNWISLTSPLEGETVRLVPMQPEHIATLQERGSDKRIWEFLSVDMATPQSQEKAYRTALEEREAGLQFPFVIVLKKNNTIIGSTRFIEIVEQHKKLEIGWTWLRPDYWATEINFECKLLLLTFCFEELQTIRVQLRTDETNLRSRKAIAKIGAQYEGIMRNHTIRANGTKRNTVYFSIIDSEWPTRKIQLAALYNEKKKSSAVHL